MKKLYTLIGVLGLNILSGPLFGQILMPTGNPTPMNTVNAACGGAVFRDNGDGGNYSNNQNQFLTICPGTPGQFLTITFTSFNTENQRDFLVIFDGNDASAPVVGVYNGGALPPSFTASNPSGCLSFRFYSDNNGTSAAGWNANLTCSAVPGTPPAASSQDCGGGQGITICSNATLPGNSLGSGMDELEAGPPGGSGSSSWEGCLLSGEQQASWYYFSPTTNGVIAFTITPSVGTTDYDWAIWGPAAPGSPTPCPAFTGLPPVRCSYARIGCTNGLGQTGMQAPNVDVSEPQGNFFCNPSVNGFVQPLNVLAGEVYVMLIDNFAATGTPFSIAFTGTTAILDCTPLPVVLENFDGKPKDNYNMVYWTTSSEVNNNYFLVEKSEDAVNWIELGRVDGAGNSNVSNTYKLVDPLPFKTTYYRLSQTDFDGTRMDFNPIVIERNDNGSMVGDVFGFYPNPASDMIQVQTFTDGENVLTIRDQTGKTLFNTIINGKTIQTVNFDNTVRNGLYFITIENGGNIQNEKLIIRK